MTCSRFNALATAFFALCLLSFFSLLAVRVFGLASISWTIVFAPLWLPFAVAMVFLATMFIASIYSAKWHATIEEVETEEV